MMIVPVVLFLVATHVGKQTPTIDLWRQFRGGDAYIPYATLSPDHKLLLSQYDDVPRVWDTQSETLLLVLPGPGHVLPAAFSKDNSRLVIADFERVNVWDLRRGKPVCHLNLKVDEVGLEDVGLSPHGSKIYCRVRNGMLIFSGTTGKLLVRSTFKGWKILVPVVRDGVLIPSLTMDHKRQLSVGNREVVLRRVQDGKVIHRMSIPSQHITGAWFINQDSEVLTTARSASAQIWDPITGKFKRNFGEPFESIEQIAVHGDAVDTVLANGYISTWDRNLQQKSYTKASQEENPVADLIISPDGNHSLKLGSPAFIRNVAPNNQPISLSDADQGCISADSKFVVIWTFHGEPRVYDARDGHFVCQLKPQSSQIETVRFSIDGTQLFAGSEDGRVSVWDIHSGKLLNVGPSLGTSISRLAAIDDGRIYAVTDGTVTIIDPNKLRPLLRLAQYEDGSWIVMSPEGKFDSSQGPKPKFGHLAVPTTQGLKSIPISSLEPKTYFVPGLAQKVLGL